MWNFITTYFQEVASVSAAISAILATFGLVFAGFQIRQNTSASRKNMYLTLLDRYYELRKMLIENEDLLLIYQDDFNDSDLTRKQEFYIHSLLAFCESLYLTDQIKAFPVTGGNWINFIRHTLEVPAIRNVWEKEVALHSNSDYADVFINFSKAL